MTVNIYPQGFDSAQFGTPELKLCNGRWAYIPGNVIDIDFNQPWEYVPGNLVDIDFNCTIGGTPDRGNLFEGFFSAYSGAEVFFTLENYPQFVVEFIDGAQITPGNTGTPTSCVTANNFGWVGSTSGITGTYSSSGARLQLNDTTGTQGVNAAIEEISVTPNTNLAVTWTGGLSGPWWDNDETDGIVYFGMFFNRTRASITTDTGTWQYNNPFRPTNYPYLRVYLPRDSAAHSAYIIVYHDGISEVVNFTKASGVDFYSGAPITVQMDPEDGNIRFTLKHNGVDLASVLSTMAWPTTIVPLWHYRNYSNPSSYVDIKNVGVCTPDLISTYPAGYMRFDPVFTDGAVVDLNLSVSTVLTASAFDGAEVSLGLTTLPAAILPIDFYEGPTLFAAVQTSLTLGNTDAYSGEYLGFDLDIHPPALLVPSLYDGATVGASLWTTINFRPIFDEGASFELALDSKPATTFALDLFDGGSASLELSTAIQLGSVLNYSGESVSVSLDSLENWNFADGACLDASLSTLTTFVPDAYDGETTNLNLSTFPSEGIGNFVAGDGAAASISLTTLVQVLLYPNEIKDPHSFNYDINGHMSIDLNNGNCCPVQDSHQRIELTAGPAPDEYYHGDKVVFQVGLYTLPRFQVSFREGSTLSVIDPNYFAVNFYTGENAFGTDLASAEYNFNICRGNFIPDGDNINVELISSETYNCESTLFFDGASVELDIQANVGITGLMYADAYMDTVLTINPAIVINFYDGPLVRVSNPEFSPAFYDGEYTTFDFEREAWLAYGGETMTIGNLTADYNVEFMERGCLDNEYVPSNENGDADFDKFNPVPVELDFFSHSIIAKCF